MHDSCDEAAFPPAGVSQLRLKVSQLPKFYIFGRLVEPGVPPGSWAWLRLDESDARAAMPPAGHT
jgi:hypothetical protein